MLDYSPNQFPIRMAGTPVFSKANARLELDGASGYEIDDSAAFSIGSQQFCIEVPKVIFGSLASTCVIAGQYDHDANQRSWRLRMNGTTIGFQYSSNGSTATEITGSTLSTGVEYDLCVERDASNVIRLYVDGSVVGSATVSATFHNSTARLGVGYDFGGGSRHEFMTGSMGGGIRMLVGDYRYGGSYTPPEPPWPTT